jgi:DNA-binding NtrC family response regulator
VARQARVLIVDDERNLRRTLEDILAEEGLVVETTENGNCAVARCVTRSFDVVLLDVRLPDLSGFEVFRQIRLHCPTTKVIMMSACSGDEQRQAALTEGVLAFLSKPMDVEALLDLLRQLTAPLPTILPARAEGI